MAAIHSISGSYLRPDGFLGALYIHKASDWPRTSFLCVHGETRYVHALILSFDIKWLSLKFSVTELGQCGRIFKGTEWVTFIFFASSRR